jgi:hypothetical protein
LDRRLGGPQSRSGCGGLKIFKGSDDSEDLVIDGRWEDNIRMYIMEIGWVVVDWMHLA